MKNIIAFIFLFACLNSGAQTIITKDLDTLVITQKDTTIIQRVPSYHVRDVVVKVTDTTYQNFPIVSKTTTQVLKKYKPPTAPANVAPIARAGNDITIQLPTSTTSLSGSSSTDADGSIAKYGWIKLNGPPGGIVNSPAGVSTAITQLQAGIYNYRLTVTDNRGAAASDEVRVIVNAAPIPDPDPEPGNTVSFAVPVIPVNEYINAPGRGAEQWHDGSAAVGNLPQSLDVYYRISWNEVETATQGVYNWNRLDGLIRAAINRGQKFSFGIMSHRPENDGDGRVSYGGAISYYPLYLHNLMQSEASNSRDWQNGGIWIPNFNSPNYIARLGALNKAINDHLLNNRYTPTSGPNAGKSILLGDAILFVDIRGFGTWGEWHTCCGIADWSQFPAGRQPTAASLKAIIDAHTQTIDNWPLVIMIAAYDAGSAQFPVFHPFADVAYYALTARNKWGPVGYRKDQWGATDEYLKKIAELNSKSFNGIALRGLIMNKWKEAPVTGEPMPGTGANLSDLVRQIKLYGATSFGNGNYGATPNSTQARFVEQAANAAGYRLQIKDGSIATGANGQIKITWENVGIAPTYENWDAIYDLKNGNTVVWTGKSSFKAKLFLPGSTTVTDNFPNIPTGNYTLTIKLIDPAGYRQPLVLANRGRLSDGSYTLKQ